MLFDIESMIQKGINRFVKPYGVSADHIQLMFRLYKDEPIYVTCIDGADKDTVSLKQLIGNNLFNGRVNEKIKELLVQLADENKISYASVNLFVSTDGNIIQIQLRNNAEKIKDLSLKDL